MPKRQYGKRKTGWLIALGSLAAVCALVFGIWYLLSAAFDPFTAFLLWDFVFGLCFDVAMYQVMAQSRPYRKEAISSASTLKAVGIGVAGGAIFLVGGAVLGALYAQGEPPAGEFSPVSFAARVLAGAIMGAAVGATFYVPLLGVAGNQAETFIDYHGIPLYFTGAIGGTVGAVTGAINSTQAVAGWIRSLAALGAGAGGAALGLLIGARFVTLFTLPFIWGVDDTVVVPVGEDEFQDIFLGKNGCYAMRIHYTMRVRIRYIAAYRMAPESAITHIARVKSIKCCKGEDKDRYILHLHSPATAIGPIRLVPEGKVAAPRRPCYASRAQLQKAGNLDEAW